MKKSIIIIIPILILVLISVAAILLYPLLYKGSDDVILLEDHDFKTLNDILDQDYLKDKILFVDIWGTTCAPCIKEFDHASILKERYKGKPVEFLYLCSIDRIDHQVRWKDIIKKKLLSGYHIPIDGAIYKNIWEEYLTTPVESKYRIPRYFIVKNGNIIVPKAERPSSGEKLYNQIDSILNIK